MINNSTNIPNIYDTIDWFEKQRPAMHSLTFDMFVAARYYLLDNLRRTLDDCGCVCEHCTHSVNGCGSERCISNDLYCAECQLDCYCKDCVDGSKWKWNGKREVI